MAEIDPELAALRNQIDSIDEWLVSLLGERFAATREVGRLKRRLDLPPKDPERETAQQARFQELAERHQVDPALVTTLFETIIAAVRADHEAVPYD